MNKTARDYMEKFGEQLSKFYAYHVTGDRIIPSGRHDVYQDTGINIYKCGDEEEEAPYMLNVSIYGARSYYEHHFYTSSAETEIGSLMSALDDAEDGLTCDMWEEYVKRLEKFEIQDPIESESEELELAAVAPDNSYMISVDEWRVEIFYNGDNEYFEVKDDIAQELLEQLISLLDKACSAM